MKSIDRPRERALRFGAAGIVAIAVCARSPSAADADHLDRPIRIERCAVESRTYLSDPFNSMRANVVTGVTVRMTNLRAQPLTRVTIEVRYAGSTKRRPKADRSPPAGRSSVCCRFLAAIRISARRPIAG